jgi:hypothetical protein
MQDRQANRLTGRTGKEDEIWKEKSKCRTGRGDKQANREYRKEGGQERRTTGKKDDI